MNKSMNQARTIVLPDAEWILLQDATAVTPATTGTIAHFSIYLDKELFAIRKLSCEDLFGTEHTLNDLWD